MQKTISVTNLKNHLLEYVRDIETNHNELIIVSRKGEPRLKISPIIKKNMPLIGGLEGTAVIPRLDK